MSLSEVVIVHLLYLPYQILQFPARESQISMEHFLAILVGLAKLDCPVVTSQPLEEILSEIAELIVTAILVFLKVPLVLKKFAPGPI